MPEPALLAAGGGLWPWAALAALGAFHGLNPAMGWLFAVALGLRRGDGRTVLGALAPIALGHAAAIALAVALVGLALSSIDPALLRLAAALLLFGFGVHRLRRSYRHRFRVGMAAGPRDLAVWSFLMATAHGAGLMVAPVLLALPICATAGPPDAPAMAAAGMATLGASLPLGLLAIAVHTAAMLAVATALAWIIFAWIGLAVLRTRWINLDLLWNGALVATGAVFLLIAGLDLPSTGT
jgi:hypothetical protein